MASKEGREMSKGLSCHSFLLDSILGKCSVKVRTFGDILEVHVDGSIHLQGQLGV